MQTVGYWKLGKTIKCAPGLTARKAARPETFLMLSKSTHEHIVSVLALTRLTSLEGSEKMSCISYDPYVSYEFACEARSKIEKVKE